MIESSTWCPAASHRPGARRACQHRFERQAFYNFTQQDPGNAQREAVSVFFKDTAGRVFHTYSAYARGIDALSVDYQYLDLVPKGRDENGRGPFRVRRRDEYGR